MKFKKLFNRFRIWNFILVFLSLTANGQPAATTSFETLSDSAKIVFLNTQAVTYITLEPDSGIYFGELALKLGFRTKRYENLNETHRILGWCYYRQQNFIKSKFHLQFALNDTLLTTYEKIKINEALIVSSEKTGDYFRAYLFTNNVLHLNDSLYQQKQDASLSQLKNQLTEAQQDHADEIKRKEKIWQMIKTRQQQLLVIAAVVIFVLVLVIVFLWFQLYRHKKYFNEVIEEKNIVIAETADQHRKLQDQLLDYEKLKAGIAKDQREDRIQKIATPEKQTVKGEEKKEQISVLDQYQAASNEERKSMLPRFESFVTIIPTQLQIIEQAFARHDWEMINNTLQTMKSIVNAAGMYQSVTLINEINEHVNANATNRAVVKLLNVKSACTKTVNEIKQILEKV